MCARTITATRRAPFTSSTRNIPAAGFWVDHKVDDSTGLRLEYDYGYAWVGGADPYLSGNTTTFSLIHNWGDVGTTVVSTRGGLE